MTDVIEGKLAIDGGKPVRTEPFGTRWFFDDRERKHLMDVIDNGVNGRWHSKEKTNAFADAYAAKYGVKYAIPVNSGTASLHSAVAAVNPEPGDEIITTPTTDIGTHIGIIMQNAIPIFADWDPETFNSDPADIESRITPRTKAIIAVHLYGNPCDMDEIMEIGRKHDIVVIEDCAQAHMAEYKGRLVGTIGDMGCFSFGGKTLTTQQGGMVITNNKEMAHRAAGFATKGAEMDLDLRESRTPTTYRRGSETGFSFLGTFYPMTDLQAAVGLAQIEKYDDYTARRRAAAAVLDEELRDVPGITLQKVREGNRHSYYVYGMLVDNDVLGVTTEHFNEAVFAEGLVHIGGPYLQGKPMYRYPIFAEARTYGSSRYPFVDEQGNTRIDYNEVHLPVVEALLPRTSSILFYSSFSEDDARDMANAVKKVANFYAANR